MGRLWRFETVFRRVCGCCGRAWGAAPRFGFEVGTHSRLLVADCCIRVGNANTGTHQGAQMTTSTAYHPGQSVALQLDAAALAVTA